MHCITEHFSLLKSQKLKEIYSFCRPVSGKGAELLALQIIFLGLIRWSSFSLFILLAALEIPGCSPQVEVYPNQLGRRPDHALAWPGKYKHALQLICKVLFPGVNISQPAGGVIMCIILLGNIHTSVLYLLHIATVAFSSFCTGSWSASSGESLIFLLPWNPGNKSAGITSEISRVLYFAAPQHIWLPQPRSFLSQYQHHLKPSLL